MTVLGLIACLAVTGCAETPVGPPDPSSIEAEPLVAQRIQEATDAVRADPSSSEAWGRLGEIYDIHRFPEQALTCYARATELAPEEWLWPYFSGIVLRESDQAAAAKSFERAAELHPDHAPLQLYLGACYLMLEDLDRSEEHFRRALELDPSSINARIGLARVAVARHQPEEAARLLEEAVQTAPEEAATHHNLAQVYRLLGRDEDAQRQQQLADWSQIAMQPGEMASLRDPVRDEVTLREGVGSTWLLENGRRMMAAGHEDQALALMEQALTADPNSEIALLGTARILFNRGNLPEARRRVERALELHPDSAPAHVELANLLARTGDVDGAVKEFEAAIALDPSLAEAQNNLAALLFEAGRTEEGLKRLRAAAAALPGETNIQFNLAAALQRMGRIDEAIEVLRSLVELRPGYAPGLHMLGFVLASRGNYTEAVDLFTRVVERQPDNVAARLDLGRASWEIGRFDAAVAAFGAARRLAPDDAEAGRELAWALATCPQDDLRDGGQALALARQLAEGTRYGDPRVLDVLAAAQAETGDFEGAFGTERRAMLIAQHLLSDGNPNRDASEKEAIERFLARARERASLYEKGKPFRDRS